MDLYEWKSLTANKRSAKKGLHTWDENREKDWEITRLKLSENDRKIFDVCNMITYFFYFYFLLFEAIKDDFF